MTQNPKSKIIPRTGSGTGGDKSAGNPGASWGNIEERLRRGEATTWLSLRTESGVHTRPLFAAWTGTSFVLASKAAALKSRYLDLGDSCTLALDLGTAHVSVEAMPSRLREQTDLERACAAFREVYDWPTTVRGDELDAPYAAPSSGGPPFRAYELTPVLAYVFPTNDQFEPTRFTF